MRDEKAPPIAEDATIKRTMTPSEYLLWVIRLADARMSDLEAIEVTDRNADLFRVTTSMVATAMNQTKAILVLVEAGFGVVAGPLERALYEIRNEFIYLLTEGEAHRNATKVLVNGALEVAEFLKGHGDADAVSNVIEHHRKIHSDLVNEIVAQRTGKPRRYHWSGKTHSAIERVVNPDAFMYRLLSWEAHAALNSVRDITTERSGDGNVRFVFGRQPAHDIGPERRCAMNTVVMYEVLRYYAATWSLPALPELPPLPAFPERPA